MQFNIKVEWRREDGSLATKEMGPVDVGENSRNGI